MNSTAHALDDASFTKSTARVPVGARIERFHDCKYLMWQAVIVSIAMFAEAVEINSFGFILPLVQKQFHLTSAFMGYLGSASNIGMMVGALCCAALADRIGRKKFFTICIVVWGIGGLMFAFAPDPTWLFIGRVVFGLGAGAQIPCSLTLLAEMSPAVSRAKYVALSLLASPIAVVFGATVATALLRVTSWRVMFVIISCLALWGIVVHYCMPESARWLETKGRFDEADAAVDDFEKKVALSSGKAIVPFTEKEIKAFHEAAVAREAGQQRKTSFGDLWKGDMIKRTLLGTIWPMLQMLGYFALATWLTALLMSKGFSVVKSTSMIAIFALGGIPAYFAMVWFLNKAGRKVAAITMAILAAGTAYIYGSMNTYTTIIIAGFIYQFCQYSYNTCFSSYLPELVPTYIRGTGMGWFQGCGRVGGILGSIVVGYIVGAGGYNGVFYLIIACNLISVILLALWGPETRGAVSD